eukprot:2568237-Rhodomonas_salina.1
MEADLRAVREWRPRCRVLMSRSRSATASFLRLAVQHTARGQYRTSRNTSVGQHWTGHITHLGQYWRWRREI